MAKILFYEADRLETTQINSYFGDSNNELIFIKEPLNLKNLDPKTEVLSVFVGSIVSDEILSKLPKLRLIACRTTGFNNIDQRSADSRGISVVNVPAYGDRTVAEYTFALMLSLSRKLNLMLKGDDKQEMGFDLFGKTLGVIGTGKIGKNVIKLAKAFGMEVLASDPYPDQTFASEQNFQYVDLDQLFKLSDVVTLHAPLLPSTEKIVNKQRLGQMKKTAILINTSRGELIDVLALVDALYTKKIKAAGLDVVTGEKFLSLKNELEFLHSHVHNSGDDELGMAILALKKMDNVILTPHNAFNTEEAVGKINSTTVENIINFLAGKPTNVVKFSPTNGKLYIVRHATSQWNGEGRWTGTRDVHLSEQGFKDAGKMGLWFIDKKIDFAYCSTQMRTFETMECILDASGNQDIPYERRPEVNERNYGEYTGKNKWEMKAELGDEIFEKVRREWDYPVPGGETLKDVYSRTLPFYLNTILPKIKSGQNVLLVAHGNSIRSLIKYIEDIPDQDIARLEMLFGSVITYETDSEGRSTKKLETKLIEQHL